MYANTHTHSQGIFTLILFCLVGKKSKIPQENCIEKFSILGPCGVIDVTMILKLSSAFVPPRHKYKNKKFTLVNKVFALKLYTAGGVAGNKGF